jgi:hypothetical protein
VDKLAHMTNGETSARAPGHHVRSDSRGYYPPIFNNNDDDTLKAPIYMQVRAPLRLMLRACCHAQLRAYCRTCFVSRAHAAPTGTTFAYVCSWNTCNIKHLLQHMSEIDETLQHTFATRVWHYNTCNIQIKHLQHTFKNSWTFEIYTCNIHV